jgi:Fe-S-cluster containining protein
MSRAAARKLQAAFAQLDALYAELPPIVCQGRCAIACGAIPLTDLEARRLQLATHTQPRTRPGLVALQNFAPPQLRERCVYLTPEDRCSVYAIRPLICRVWGLVRMLSCMHGCVPDRWLQDVEFLRLAQRVERIAGGRVVRTGPQGLEHTPGESFASVGVGAPLRSAAAIERTAERTRTLRALHGGRVIVAIDAKDDA